VRHVLAAFLLAVSMLAHAETWHFGLLGDTPYSPYERRELPRMLNRINDSQVAFIAHIGDFKGGQERCDDETFVDRLQLFDASNAPFIFVPGDNEWSDCERISNGAYDPLERLNKLRALFWPDNRSLGQKRLTLERQPGGYPEHARFRLGPVLFVSFNLPGGNNNFGMTDVPRAEFTVRNPAVLDWLSESFALARREKLAGIVLLFQADPDFHYFAKGFPYRGYRDFLERLRSETMTFPGEVVVVHGDTHMSRIDQPLTDGHGRTLTNFTRVETFGYPIMGWTRGSIDTESPRLFRFETHRWPEKEH